MFHLRTSRPRRRASCRRHKCSHPPPPRLFLLFLLQLLLTLPCSCFSSPTFYLDPSYQYVTTTDCDLADAASQAWIVNASSQMIYLASDTSRCLSLVPNAADVNVMAACSGALVKGGVLVNGVLRQAYDITEMGKYCSEFIQTIGRWHGMQFNDFSNIVTTQDCFDPGNAANAAGTTHTPLFTREIEQPHWIVNNETGTIVNRESGACMQLGGDLSTICYREANEQYIRPSVYPAYIFPCGRSCNPTIMQWELEAVPSSIITSLNTPASSGAATASASVSAAASGDGVSYYRIRLRDHPSLCLRAGIDKTKVYAWFERSEPLIAGLLTLVLLLIALVVEYNSAHRCSRSTLTRKKWQDSHLFHQGGWWWILRLALSTTGIFQMYFGTALNLRVEWGGRAFYPRQLMVHGTLLYIGCFFAHAMLMARDDTDDPRIESVSRDKQVDRIFCGLYRFCCAPRREHFKIMLSIRTRPALFIHALSVFGMRSWLSFRFGVHNDNTGQRGVLTQANGLFFLALSYILPRAFAQVASMIARVRVGDSEYQTNCLSRWWRILLIQFAVLVSALFSPGGAPSWLPIISVNILVLAILFESLLGTIKERNLENWSSKYHVVLLTMFSVPLFLVTVFELVAMAVSSPLTFGQVHMQNVGATGGTSNQMLGSVNSNGWWFGLSDETMMWVSMTCYFGMLASLIVLPHLLVLVGFRGPKAPQYLAKILHKTGGHVPLLSRENHFHFFITKHEKHKELALKIAKALSDANFKVWLSQTEATAGRSIEKNGMQEGVRRSESLLLLMTDGIFHADRFWVTKTEVSYGVLQHNKPLICLSPTIDEGGFKFEDKCQGLPGADGRVHPKGCCHSVHESFQPFARAIPIALDVVKTWQYSNSKESGITVSRTESETMRYLVVEIVKRYLLRDDAKKRLMRELEAQAQLGACGEVEVAPQMTGMAKEESHDEETKAHSSAGMENVVSRFNIG